jgi:hypothetical protein
MGTILALAMSALVATSPTPRTEREPVTCAAGQVAPVEVAGHGAVAHLAEELSERATDLYERSAAFTGARDCAPIEVHLVEDNEAARRLLPRWHLPPWAAGAARPDERTIVLTVHNDGVRQQRERVFLHELAHLATASAAGDARVPRWFDEGVARRLAGEDGMDDDEILARARLGERLLLLEGLEVSFPAGKAQAAIAYAVAGRGIEILESEHGSGVVRRILARVRAGELFDDALEAEAGLRTWQLTGRVERSVALWHAWMTVLKDIDIGLALGAFVLIYGGFTARRRIRKRIAEMPDPHDPPKNAPFEVHWARWTVGATPKPTNIH